MQITAGNKEKALKLIFQNFFFGKIYFTAYRFKICDNKKFERDLNVEKVRFFTLNIFSLDNSSFYNENHCHPFNLR